MNTNISPAARSRMFRLTTAIAVLAASLALFSTPASADEAAAVGVSGEAVPWPAAPTTCDPLATGPIDYVLAMPAGAGSLTGCLYGTRQGERFNSGGQLQTKGIETFVGCWGTKCGSFELEGFITSRWDAHPATGGNQINGRCQHKIVSGSGTGDFVGVEGRLDFKDILDTDTDGTVLSIVFDYKGHLQFR